MSTNPPCLPWPTCPRCRQRLAALAACPACGLSLATLDEVYGSAEVVLERVVDAPGVLGQEGRRRVEQAILQFEAAFPQAWVAVHVTALGSGPALRQFGFWLLNRAALAGVEATRPNENGLLLVLDPMARLAAVTLGYQLEPWLPEATVERALGRAQRDFQRRGLAGGAVRVVNELGAALRAALRGPGPVAEVAATAGPLSGLLRLRGRGGLVDSPQNADRHDS